MTNPETRLLELRAAHVQGYASTSDEVWDRNPICSEDGHAWPCPVAEALGLVGAEVSHRINPVLGWLRVVDHHADYQNPQHEQMIENTIARLNALVAFFREDW